MEPLVSPSLQVESPSAFPVESSTFFFRQRHGHINLRKFESINLEKLIREVDIDILQQNLEEIAFSRLTENDLNYLSDRQIVKLFRLAQLTIEYLLYSQNKIIQNFSELAKKYTSKKKTLYRKRKELSSLKEETNSLYAQLKAKRRNLATLEKILREQSTNYKANKKREQEEKQKELEEAKEESKFVKFFITFSDGLFIEFEEPKDIPIRKLHSLLKNILIENYYNHDTKRKNLLLQHDFNIKFFFKGKLLLFENTLEQCNIKNGDTILAVAPQVEEIPPQPNPQPIVQPIVQPPAPDTTILLPVINSINNQIEAVNKLTQELHNQRNYQKPEVIPSNDEIIHKIKDLGEDIKSAISKNADNDRIVIASKPRLIFGDLENDNQPVSNVPDISNILNEFKADIKNEFGRNSLSVDRLKDMVSYQQKDIEELKKRSFNVNPPSQKEVHYIMCPHQNQPIVNSQPVVQHVPQPIIINQSPQPTPQPQPQPKIFVQEPKIEVKQEQKIQAKPEPKILPKSEPKEAKVLTPEYKQEVKLFSEPITIEAEPEIKQEVYYEEVIPQLKKFNFTFPLNYHSDFVPFYSPKRKIFNVEIEFEPNTEKSVLNLIRAKVCNYCSLPFDDIYFEYKNNELRNYSDLIKNFPNYSTISNDDLLKVLDKSFVNGEIILKRSPPELISNTQIDLLAPGWEKARKSNSYKKDLSKSISSLEKTQKKVLEDTDDDDEEVVKSLVFKNEKIRRISSPKSNSDKNINSYSKTRSSLTNMLEYLNTKDSLSDYELKLKQNELGTISSGSDSEFSKKFKGDLANAMGEVSLSHLKSVTPTPRTENINNSFRLSINSDRFSTGDGNDSILRGSYNRRSLEEFYNEKDEDVDSEDDQISSAKFNQSEEEILRESRDFKRVDNFSENNTRNNIQDDSLILDYSNTRNINFNISSLGSESTHLRSNLNRYNNTQDLEISHISNDQSQIDHLVFDHSNDHSILVDPNMSINKNDLEKPQLNNRYKVSNTTNTSATINNTRTFTAPKTDFKETMKSTKSFEEKIDNDDYNTQSSSPSFTLTSTLNDQLNISGTLESPLNDSEKLEEFNDTLESSVNDGKLDASIDSPFKGYNNKDNLSIDENFSDGSNENSLNLSESNNNLD